MIKLPVAALIVVVALLGGFYGGYKIGGGRTASAATSGNGTSRTGNDFAGGRGAAACPSPGASASASPSAAAGRRGATGIVSNLTSNSLTVHDARCNTDVKVTFDQSVIIRKSVVGQTSDLSDNQAVVVTGSRQADGSIKANSITIGAAGTGGGFGGFGGGLFGASPPSN
jgi:hypothetical protein